MKKKRNVIRRNSGFIVGCLLAAGASYFTADTVLTQGLPSALKLPDEGTETQLPETAETVAPETSRSRVYETDAFTVTASGNIIKGVETEVPKQTEPETEAPETDENGNPVTDTENSWSGEGSGSSYEEYDQTIDVGGSDDGYYDDGYYDDGYYDDGSYDDGYYDDGSYDDGYYDDGSSGGGYSEPSIDIQDPGGGDYVYDDGGSSSEMIFAGTSERYIDESELYNYSAEQLRLIRNEIFARHGRIFTSQDLIDYFSQKSWYVPTYAPEDFDANMFSYLNDYEVANLQVIMNYEAALAGN